MRVHALILVACAVTGCAGAQVKTDADKDADFSRYHSYTLQRGRVLSDRSAPDVSTNPLLEERIQKAIARELARKGLEPTDPANRRIEFAVLATQPIRPTPVDTPGPR